MDKGNFNASHFAWCGLIAIHIARRDGLVNTPAQENLFISRWLATAEKQGRFPKEHANDIRWLLKESREKGQQADLAGKLDYLWRSGSGELRAQNDLFRLQHALQAMKLNGWLYMLLSESEWNGRRQLQLSTSVPGIYVNRRVLDNGFSELGQQKRPLPVRITGELSVIDTLLLRSGWRREPVVGPDPLLYQLISENLNDA